MEIGRLITPTGTALSSWHGSTMTGPVLHYYTYVYNIMRVLIHSTYVLAL